MTRLCEEEVRLTRLARPTEFDQILLCAYNELMMNSQKNTKKKKIGRPTVIKNGRNVNLYLGINHYNFAQSQNCTMSAYIRSLIERDMMEQKKQSVP